MSEATKNGFDKEKLYGNFLEPERWKQKLFRKAAHMSLDIPDDEMNVTNANRVGMGWKELLVLACASLGAWWMYQSQQPPVAVTPPAFSVNDSEYEVRFYDADGNPIAVPHISQRSGG